MAEIKIQIKDELYAKLVDACAAKYAYDSKAPVKRTGPIRQAQKVEVDTPEMSKEDFLVAIIKQEFLDGLFKTGSLILAHQKATKETQEQLKDISL